MKRSKGDLLIFFFYLFFSIIFVIGFIGKLREIRGILRSADRYQRLLSETQPLSMAYLSQLEYQAEHLWKAEPVLSAVKTKGFQSPEERIGMIRDLLRKHKLGVERFRTTGKDGNISAEFTLDCGGVNFFNFLKQARELRISPNYISIKPASNYSNINVTVRFNNVP
jgi:hypothetical protein